MTYEAPKLATLVDDFRNISLDTLQWSRTGAGTAVVRATDTATAMRGLSLLGAMTVTSQNTTAARRFDFWDSEIVWIIGQWSVATLNTLSITQNGGQYGYRFEYTNGVLVVKSIEGGTTYTGAAFLDGSGNTVNWGQSLKYMRIAHNASTGKVEFFAGTNPDGSDQRIMTSDLGTGSKGTLKPTQAQIDNMTVTMATTSGGTQPLFIRAVNAPAGGLPRSSKDEPGSWYYRDFNTWTGYVANGFNQTNLSLSHEWYTVSTYDFDTVNFPAVAVENLTLTEKVMKIQGDGGAQGATVLLTGFSTGIKDVSFETVITPLSFGDSASQISLFWRNQSFNPDYGQGTNGTRYQLNILPGSMEVGVYSVGDDDINEANSAFTASFLTKTATFNTGQTYKIRVNHFGTKITVYVDDVQVMDVTDLANWLPGEGQIGFAATNLGVGSGSVCKFAVHSVDVTTAYDEGSFTAGTSMQDRGLGIHRMLGRRDAVQTTMADNPSIVAQAEVEYQNQFKTVYHFTTPYAGNSTSAPIDNDTLAAARQHGLEGRTNFITINAFNPESNAGGNNFASGVLDDDIDAWTAALNTIPGNLWVSILPFPNLNVPWSPFGYDAVGSASSATHTTSTLTDESGGMTTNTYAGYGLRFQDTLGNYYWTTVTSNTASTITFVPVSGAVPGSNSSYFLRSNSAGGRIRTQAAYVSAYQYIVGRMKAAGCKAKFAWAINWAHDIPWKHPSKTDIRDSYGYNTFKALNSSFPGNSYVDGILIRAINQGLSTGGHNLDSFKPLSKMLEGGTTTTGSRWQPEEENGIYKWAEQWTFDYPTKPFFVVGGSYETHGYYNDFSSNFVGEPIALSSNEHTDLPTLIDASGTPARIWSPAAMSEFNPKSDSLDQQGVQTSYATSGAYNMVRYDLPSSGIDRCSVSCYVRFENLTTASSAGFIGGIFSAANTVLRGLRIDGNTGTVYQISNASQSSSGSSTGATLSINKWYRFDMTYVPDADSVWSITEMTNRDSDRPIVTWSGSASAPSTSAPAYVKFGNGLSNQAKAVQGDMQMQDLKVSWDGVAMTHSKAAWIRDALNTRGFPRVRTLMLFDGDYIQDIPMPTVTIVNSAYKTKFTPMQFSTNKGDTRLTGAKYTSIEDLKSLNTPNAARIHTAPQLFDETYVPTAKVGELEYLYLKETGHAPLYLTPRSGGILLRDFNLGIATVRAAQEDRPNSDGIRDYSKYYGAKAVSLSLVLFEDASGSAAYYADVVAAWANARRRPKLVYKLKDGVERTIRLRPDTNDANWTIDGIRAGFKETSLSFVGIDGKDYSTEEKSMTMRQAIMTQVTTPGTAATPPKIRIYGGPTGCLNPTIILQSKEQEEGDAIARISLGKVGSSVFIPANQFLEIDMDEKTVQLNGNIGEGYSYLKYLSDRQWFYLETYYNTMYLETEDGNGFASIIYRDAYL